MDIRLKKAERGKTEPKLFFFFKIMKIGWYCSNAYLLVKATQLLTETQNISEHLRFTKTKIKVEKLVDILLQAKNVLRTVF